MNPTAQHRLKALEDWKRIEWIIAATGRSVHSFARHIGLKRAENLYHIKHGRNGISRALADRIHRYYPMVSAAWISTGCGPKQGIGFRIGTTEQPSISMHADAPHVIVAQQAPLEVTGGRIMRLPSEKQTS